jgi:hypothetical protein
MLFFATFALSDLVHITAAGFAPMVSGRVHTFVNFFHPSSKASRTCHRDFVEAAATFSQVDFGLVDCLADQDLCDAQNITEYPTMRLYMGGSFPAIPFADAFSFNSFCAFVENRTHARSRRPFNAIRDLNPRLYNATVPSSRCAVVAFFDPTDGNYRRFAPELGAAAVALMRDPHVTVAAVNCAQYSNLCESEGARSLSVRLFRSGARVDFTGTETTDGVLGFVNANCGTQRAADGFLVDDAGIDPVGRQLVREFLAEGADKQALIARAKEVDGLQEYVSLMELYLEVGIEELQVVAARLLAQLEARVGSFESQDAFKKKYNVLALFVPRPTARPEPRSTSHPFENL